MSGLVGIPIVMLFLTFAFTALLGVAVSVLMIRALGHARLADTGEVAQARILETELLPPSKYGDRACFTLEVHRLDGRVYQAQVKHRVHALHAHLLQVGCLVDVRVDPARPERIWLSGPSSGTSASQASSPSVQKSPQRPRLAQAAAPSAQSLRQEWPPTL